MNKVLKGSLAVGLVLGLGGFTGVKVGEHAAERKAARTVHVEVKGVPYVDDAEHMARGKYLFETRGCTDCHGENGAGREFANEGGMRLAGPNLTGGEHSATRAYGPADWDRAIRHGVSPSGRPLLIMPSGDYAKLGDDDLASLVAYVRSLPSVSGTARVVELPTMFKTLYAAGVVKDAAEEIDHTATIPTPPPRAPSAAYGGYVAQTCTGCHGAHFSGGKIQGGPPDWPEAANLTPGEGSAMVRYADLAAFKAMLQSGKRPDGSAVSPVMPFQILKNLDDTDVAALFAHFKALPARPFGEH
jgi:cytochrome c553